MMGKRTGVAYGGTIRMALLPAIETQDVPEDGLMSLLQKTRAVIARELESETEQN